MKSLYALLVTSLVTSCSVVNPIPHVNPSSFSVSAPVNGTITITCVGSVTDIQARHVEFTIPRTLPTPYQNTGEATETTLTNSTVADSQNRINPVKLGTAENPVKSGDDLWVDADSPTPFGIYGNGDQSPVVTLKVP